MTYYRSPFNKGDRSKMPSHWTVTKHLQIEHSGHVFNSCVFDTKRGVYVWPIEEYLCRSKHSRGVVERIQRLNQNGNAEGELPRGVRRKKKIYPVFDYVSVRSFIKSRGVDAYRALPKSAFIRRGLEKVITMQAALDGY